ncbi:putative zinc-binding metallopeptidase [Labilibaculum sp.]|uniref:zinc-binding metallopeptidase n=1 Tax=Labilibaculum sp. TaxID=2060723 RepID=UPI002AA77093|nr:putative zinc-binding metallopeptidase [Labilibaculum sp.]
MNKIKYWLFVMVMVFVLSACSEDDEPNPDESVISVEAAEKNDFDRYLEKTFVDTYNISFQYKLQDIESDMNYALVPASYENSIKMANLIKYLCLDAYEEVAPEGFLKKYFPKMFMMVGSAGWHNNGTYTLGTAEGGLKITLYLINDLDVTDVQTLYSHYFRTIFHEFSHILHQTKDYTTDFDKISVTDYVGDSWNDAWDGQSSLARGFISDYSSKEANEDFVELIAHYITNTPESWDAKIESAGDTGKAILAQKMAIIKSYLKEVWSIDIDALRNAIQTRAEKLGEQDLDNITIE